MLRKLGAAGALLSSLLAGPQALATIVDPDFSEAVIATKVGAPTAMAWAPDGSSRLFVTSKFGDVWILEDGKRLPTPFVTISPIETVSECGLLGIAFDPDFISNQYVYLFVTVSASEQQIVRYTANGDVGQNPRVIVRGLPTLARNHDGGALAFGPDGKLYFAVGDNGAKLGVGADLTLLNAKLSRVNRDGSVPSDNPFFDGDGPHNDYIWASGFRNPFTMTFQPSTGQLWLDVVGTRWEQVFTPHAGDNGGYITYESNQPEGFLAPVISYATNVVETHTIPASGSVRLGGVATVYTADEHHFRPGAKITVAGVSDASFDGTFAISAALSPTQFSYLQTGPDAVSGNGTASSQDIGGCVTGGTFWDSSAVPAAYRGNFFFGDYNSGRIMRATLDPNNHVTSVDEWATEAPYLVDLAIGNDGSLFYATVSGAIGRISYGATSQALVVSQQNVRIAEGGQAAFTVRLAVAPATAISVVLARTGDADVTLPLGSSLSFTPDNWAVPQRVVLAAAVDADSIDDTARVRVTSKGLSFEDVTVRVTDAGDAAPTTGTGGAGGAPEATPGGAPPSSGGAPASSGAGAVELGGGGMSEAAPGDGGQISGGGQTSEGGQISTGQGPQAPAGGELVSGNGPGAPSTDGGCGCELVGAEPSSTSALALVLGLLLLRRRRDDELESATAVRRAKLARPFAARLDCGTLAAGPKLGDALSLKEKSQCHRLRQPHPRSSS